MYTLMVLAHLRMRWSLSGRYGFGTLFPSYRACEAGFGEFSKVFFTVFSAPDAGFGSTGRWFSEHRTLATRPVNTLCYNLAGTKHWTLRWCCTGRWSGTVHASGGYVTLAASSNPRMHRTQWRPLTHRQTRPVSENRLWMLTGVHRTLGGGRWVLGVGRIRCSLKRPLNFERVRHVARSGAPDIAECVRCVCVGAFGTPKFCPMTLLEGVSLYIGVGQLRGVTLGHFDILTSSWAEHTPSHSSPLLDWQIKVGLSDLKCICLWVYI
jgi:hypothetical protein